MRAMKPRQFFLASSIFIVLVASQSPARAAAKEPDRGPSVYAQHCAACHGPNGDGNGPAAVWLYPKPRDFSAGLFKIKSTPGQSLPTDEDLFQSVTRGLPGSSMPSFTCYSEQERRGTGQYTKRLRIFVDKSGKRINNDLAGTSVAPYGDDGLKPNERSAHVHHVQSPRRTDVLVKDQFTPEAATIRVKRVAQVALEQHQRGLDRLMKAAQ
jgi:hypothetical protein